MVIKQVRIANVLLVLLLLFSHSYGLLWYVAAMHCSLELLNSRPNYTKLSYKTLNTIFWLYEWVLVFRLRKWRFPETIEWLFNCAEHISFALIVCLKMYVYWAVFMGNKNYTRLQRGCIAAVLFNIIGLVNEVFQNYLANRPLLVFIPDSIKDLGMNLIGTSIFLLVVLGKTLMAKKSNN